MIPLVFRIAIALALLGAVVVGSTVLFAVADVNDNEGIVIVGLAGLAVTLINTGLIHDARKQVRTRNGDTLGSLVDAISDRLLRHETKLDAIEVELREENEKLEEHVEEVRPLRLWVEKKMEEEA
jgi:hypothetical protein